MKKVKVAILGAGTAGLYAASQVRKITDDFVIINQGHYGTTCARVGCMPSKVFIHAVRIFNDRKKFNAVGISGGDNLSIDTKALMKHVRELRDGFVSGVLRGISSDEKYNIKGKAVFIEPDVLEVNEQQIKADKIIIATGSSPVIPEPWKKFGDLILTTDSFFELEALPKSLGVIGLGVIGLELGQAVSMLGLDIAGFDMLKTIGGISDPKVNNEAIKIIGQDFPIHLGEEVELKKDGNKLLVNSGDISKKFDKVLLSVGRKPNINELGLDKIGVKVNEKGLPSFNNNTMQIEGFPIFIAGDITGDRPVMHEASDEGKIAGFNVLRDNPLSFNRRTPLGICFCSPNIAFCGARYKDIHDQNIIIGVLNFSKQGRAKAMMENQGLLRIYAGRDDGKLLGAEMIAPEGEHLAHLISWGIQSKMTAFDMIKMPFYHPVLEEGLANALKMITSSIDNKKSNYIKDLEVL